MLDFYSKVLCVTSRHEGGYYGQCSYPYNVQLRQIQKQICVPVSGVTGYEKIIAVGRLV